MPNPDTRAIDALREIARVSIPCLNPDGVDQAAETMHLIATETLRALGLDVPEQRQSVQADPNRFKGLERA